MMIRFVFRVLRLMLIVLIASAAIVVLYLSGVRAHMFVHPDRSPVSGTPSDYGLRHWRDVSITSSDGTRLSGWFILPDEQRPSYPTILFVHGIAGNRMQFIQVTQWLTQQGYGVLLFDLRNHGSSEGTITTMGLHEVEDVKAAFAYLVAQPEVDSTSITLFGHSMGGATAIMAMAQLPQARALIVDTAYISLLDVTNDGVESILGRPLGVGDLIMGMTNVLSGANMYAVRPIDVISSISPRPILIIHGTQDPTIPMSHSVALYDKAQDPKSLWLVEGGVHGNLYALAQTEYEERLLHFLQTDMSQ